MNPCSNIALSRGDAPLVRETNSLVHPNLSGYCSALNVVEQHSQENQAEPMDAISKLTEAYDTCIKSFSEELSSIESYVSYVKSCSDLSRGEVPLVGEVNSLAPPSVSAGYCAALSVAEQNSDRARL